MTRHPYRAGMDFHVLGPSAGVARRQYDLEVRGAKERTLLAHLVAYAGQVVPSAALIESLWGEHPPRSADQEPADLRPAAPQHPGARQAREAPGSADRRHGATSWRSRPADTDAGSASPGSRKQAGHALAGGRPEAALDAGRDALDLWRGDGVRRLRGHRLRPGRGSAGSGELQTLGRRDPDGGPPGARPRDRGRARARAARRRAPAARAAVGSCSCSPTTAAASRPRRSRTYRPGARSSSPTSSASTPGPAFARCTPGSSRRTRPSARPAPASRDPARASRRHPAGRS